MPETLPSLRLLSKLPGSVDAVIVGVTDRDGKPAVFALEEFEYLNEVIARTDARSALDTVTKIPDPRDDRRSIIFTGLGSSDVTPDVLRDAVGAAVRKLNGAKSLGIALPTASIEETAAIAEGALLGGYTFTQFQSKPNTASGGGSRTPLTAISIVTQHKSKPVIDRSRAVAAAAKLVKDLVNTPPNVLSPAELAARATAAAKPLPIRVKVWDEKQLEREGFGGIVGVGQGSSRPPRLVRLAYSPAKHKNHIALVGKGITFDTGGLSLKPASSMLGMKYDMTGAATVLAAICAIASLELPIAVTAWMCIAENMPSGTAIRPNDVLKMYGGITVEVTNTDAEGRLVLADGLVAAEKEKPSLIIDVATLTGAASVALGNRYAGAMGDHAAVAQFVESATDAGEQFWPMPMPSELASLLKSDVADLMNAKVGNTAGGMLVGAAFLREFVGTTPWVHLDIASTANNPGGAYGFTGAGPTATAVRALIRHAERLSSK
ncbi:MAG: leucyl aminopeptidase [Actinobacteria bacterium]|nr:leucyl aminopeptidase [Actinomycetota bacterium]